MSLPYMPLFIDDYEAATAHLSMLEDGAYMRLLRLCWRSPGCKLPNDQAWIMRKMRATTDAEISAVLSVLDEFFTTGRGKIWSKRLLEEHMTKAVSHSKRVAAGKIGGTNKAKKTKEIEPSNAKAMLKQPEPEPEPKIEEVGKPTSRPFSDFWASWPNKVAKAEAEAAWRKLSPSDRDQAILSIGLWFSWWRAENPRASPIHAATYLNKRRWQDDRTPSLQFGGRHEQRHHDTIASHRPENRPDPALANIARIVGLGQA